MPAIGRMRDQVTFQQETQSADGGGGYALGWANVDTDPTVWARVTPMRGGESVEAGQVMAESMYKIVVRYRDDITEKHQLLWNGVPYNIRQVRNMDERRRFLEIFAEMGVAQ